MEIDTGIIEACIRGDSMAQEQLYKQCYTIMFPVCMRYVGQREEAQEVYNNSLVKVFNGMKSYSGKGSFTGWIKRIVINTCLDHLRKRSMQVRSIDKIHSIELHAAADAEEKDEIHYLNWLLTRLPHRQAQVFNLYAIDGFSHREVSKTLGISEGNSKYLLHQARKTLQEILKKTKAYEGE